MTKTTKTTPFKTPARKPTKIIKDNPSIIPSKVRVIIRVRPFLPSETKERTNLSCDSFVSAQFGDNHGEVSVQLKDLHTSRNECYKVDGYFGQEKEDEDENVGMIFEKEVKPLIDGIFEGINATVFAYGATGSGKTYTMQGTDEERGLMQLAMSTVLSMCQASGNIVEISYYEVYLDRCYDLLNVKANEISVLDDKEGQIHLRGLSRVPVNSMTEFHEVLARGIERRKVAHTGLNDVSSRSHGVLVVTVSTPSGDVSQHTVIGKLNLIDLAGNEDNRRSGNEGIRILESSKINQSLFALSNVIHALNNNKPWVPYRESKLTRILQDSLGGTSHALMIACLNPGEYQESVHTVSLAARSRQITNNLPSAQKEGTPKVRIDMEAKLQAWLESKGKTNASHRTGPFSSPFFLKTPGSVNSKKKLAVQHSSVNAKSTNRGTSTNVRAIHLSQKKLFQTEAAFPKDNVGLQEAEDVVDCLSSTDEVSVVPPDGFLSSSLASLDITDSCCSVPQVEDPNANDSAKENVVDGSEVQLAACFSDEPLKEDESMARYRDCNFFQSPSNRPCTTSCQSPLRKALSPINSNITRLPVEEISSKDDVKLVLLGSCTPKTPFVSARAKFFDFGTPLDKFSARTSNLKSFMVEEYIDFLNTATREQLLELKGIGVKRAEYIIELRESSPLKSLSDLEKIGLSSKQVHHMFTRAAKNIFE